MKHIVIALALTLISCTISAQCLTGSVTFKVDMRNETVAPDGVFFASILLAQVPGQTAWSPVPMCDLGNGIWEISFCGVPAGDYDYKFQNGLGGWEFPSGGVGPCNNPLDNNNRTSTVTGGADIDGPHCFNTCDILCGGMSDPGGTDATPPTMTTPTDITLQCDDVLPPMDCIPLTDDCSYGCTSDLPSDDITGIDGCGLGTVVRTWSGSDVAGNTVMATQMITYEDTDQPFIDGAGIIDVTVSCDNIPVASPIPAMDDCDLGLTASMLPVDDLSGIDPVCGTGVILRSWTATDCGGLSASISQMITVVDAGPPMIDATTISDVTVACDILPTAVTLPVVDDCHVITDTGLPVDDLSGLDGCGVGVILRTWTASDCASIVTFTQMITREDVLAPIITDLIPADITIACGDMLPVETALSATDCDATITDTGLPTTDPSAIGPCGTGDIVRTWTVTDCSGASTSTTQTITVIDVLPPIITPPIPDTEVISCTSDLPPLLPLSATDVCDASITTTAPPTDDLSGLDALGIGTVVRTWVATDCNGNTANVSMTFVIEGVDVDFDLEMDYCEGDQDQYLLPSTDLNGISGTWIPNGFRPSDLGLGSHFFDFVADGGFCARPYSAEVVVTDGQSPLFDIKSSYCAGDAEEYDLPISDQSGVLGTWIPATIGPSVLGAGSHSFFFNPDPFYDCVSTYELVVTIDSLSTLELAPLGPYCSTLMDTIVLDSVSSNGILGSWSVDSIIVSTLAPDTFSTVFTPLAGQCAVSDTVFYVVADAVEATFRDLTMLCALDSSMYVLPDTSDNLIVGVWVPSVIVPAMLLGGFEATFTADPGQCASDQRISITAQDPATPDFDPIGPFCKEDSRLVTLPLVSTNGVAGTWDQPTFSPSTIPRLQPSFVFTPEPSSCAESVMLDVQLLRTEIEGTFIFCEGEELNLRTSRSGTWTYNGDTITVGRDYIVPGADPSLSGEYCFYVDYGDDICNVCRSVRINPQVELLDVATICAADGSYYLRVVSDTATSWQVSQGDLTVISPDTIEIRNIAVGSPINVEVGSFCRSTYMVMASSCNCATPAEIVDIAVTTSERCIGSPIFVSAIITGVDSSYYRLAETYAGVTLQGDTLGNTVMIADQPGNYWVVLTTADPDGNSPECVAAVDSIEVSIVATPDPPVPAVPVIAVCQDSILLPLSAIGDNLQWYDQGGLPLGNQAPIPSTALLGITTYGVTQNVQGCESNLAIVAIEVQACDCATPATILDYTISTAEVCVGDTIDLTVVLNNIAFSGGWISSDVSVVDGVGSSVLTTDHRARAVARGPGTAEILYITIDPDSSDPLCRPDSATVVLEVKEQPPIPVLSGTTTYCVGDFATVLSASGDAVLWYDSSLSPLPTAPIPSTTDIGTTTYYATQTVDGCTSDLASIVITTMDCGACPDPVVITDIQVSDTEICVGDEVRVIATINGPTQNGTWVVLPDDAGTFSMINRGVADFSPSMDGTVSLQYITIDPDGDGPCSADSAAIDMVVSDPSAIATVSDIDCDAVNGLIVLEVSSEAYTIQLLSPAALLVQDSIIVAAPGWYVYEITAGSCSVIDSAFVEDLRYDLTLPAQTIIAEVGEMIALTAPEVATADAIIWKSGDDLLLDQDSLIIEVEGPGVVDLSISEGTCTIRYQFEIVVEGGPPLKDYLPNVIARGGLNSVFGLPQGAPFREIVQLSILDRWGNVVHAVADIPVVSYPGWQGQRGGTDVQTGVYVYYMQVLDFTGRVHTAIGDVTVLR